MDRKEYRKKYMDQYNNSERGKAAQARYNSSSHGKETRSNYNKQYRGGDSSGCLGILCVLFLFTIILVTTILSGCTHRPANDFHYQKGYAIDFSKPVTVRTSVSLPEKRSYNEQYTAGN
jgi:hypothetical protein